MFNTNLYRIWEKYALATTLAILSAALITPAWAQTGAVYTMTNEAGGNSVVMYSRSANGSLDGPQFFPTGGAGSGAGLGSQGAVMLNGDGRWLIAVNAGSNDVTVFSTEKATLNVTDREPSGGAMPISVAIFEDLVFVLNAGAPANITGFRLTSGGTLEPWPGTTRVLPGAAPAQVSFANNGANLVITEKASNTITVYALEGQSLAGPFSHPSSGVTPFGFGVSKTDILVVSDAAGGAPGASTVSSYIVEQSGSLHPVTAAMPTGESAACWVAVTQNGKYAYVANTGSGTISSLAVGRDGALTLLQAVAGATPPGTPAIDLAVSVNSRYLYSLAQGTVSAFGVSATGELSPLQVVTGLPPSTVGLAVR